MTSGEEATEPGELQEQRGWHVRPAQPGDANSCAELAVAAWQRVHDAYTAIIGAEMHERLFAGWQGRKARDVRRAVGEQPERALVAVAGAAVIGFVTFQMDTARAVGVIGNNAVHPQWQGRGIAQALYQAVLTTMRANGMRLAQVTTGLDEGHAPARSAYAKAGFAVGLPSVTYYQDLGETTIERP